MARPMRSRTLRWNRAIGSGAGWWGELAKARDIPAFAIRRDASAPPVLNCKSVMARQLKIVVEKHHDGYIAYPLGIKGVVVGEGDSYEEALSDVKSAIQFHLESFGDTFLADESPVIDAFIVDATVAV
jgi:predicted RNase H-like HicB family nuclease